MPNQPRPDYALGLDIGTSSVKAALLDNDGQTAATRRMVLQCRTRHGAHSEQDPREWLEAIQTALQWALDLNMTPRVIGLCVNTSSLVCEDTAGHEQPHMAILWNDQRAQSAARRIEQALQCEHPRAVVRADEPASRYLHWLQADPAQVQSIVFSEAATWIIENLTGQRVLPASLYYGRWGLLAEPAHRRSLFACFPDLEPLYNRAFATLAGWRDCVGHLELPSSESPSAQTVPLYCSGNDGLSALFGSGHLFDTQAEFFLCGTSTLHLMPADNGPASDRETLALERIADLDILLGRAFTLIEIKSDCHACIDRRIREIDDAAASGSPTVVLIGGGSDNYTHPTGNTARIVYCSVYAGAVGTAAFAAIAHGMMADDMQSAGRSMARNWRHQG